MDGAALAPAKQVGYWRFLIAAVLLGGGGSLVAISAFGQGTYVVGPLVVNLKMRPDTTGVTELAVNPLPGLLNSGVTEAPTHQGFLAFRATVTGIVGDPSLPAVIQALKDPTSLATTIRDQGKDATKKFLLKVSLLTLAGGASGGFAIALIGFKTRRVFQGLIAGAVLVGVLGLIAWQTYDMDEFKKVQFHPAAQALAGD
jgi:hypothetical protein